MQESETGKLPKDQREANENKIKKTQIFSVFGADMRTVVECLSCNHKSITHERYYDLNIVRVANKVGVPKSKHSA